MPPSEFANDWSIDPSPVSAPPPPGVRAQSMDVPASSVGSPSSASTTKPTSKPTTKGHSFDAELEVGEMDERGHPGAAWGARGREVSRERLVFLSRRMVRRDSHVIIAVHMVDDEPMPLFGKVMDCDYEADGLHRIVVEFRPVPWNDELHGWIADRAKR